MLPLSVKCPYQQAVYRQCRFLTLTYYCHAMQGLAVIASNLKSYIDGGHLPVSPDHGV